MILLLFRGGQEIQPLQRRKTLLFGFLEATLHPNVLERALPDSDRLALQ
jgi:hypothetical protein